MTRDLRRLGERLPPSGAGQVRAFLCVRNERDRLPFLLSFYRRAGVQWFFIIDNRSDDGTAEFCLEQPDCSVFRAEGDFGRANCGMAWINGLFDEYGVGHWRLFVDADELLTYRGDATVTLPALCSYLEANGYEGLYAFMLDLYPDGPLAAARYEPGADFREVCPLFDREYRFRDRLSLPGLGTPFPGYEVVGGPRLRRFYPEFQRRGAFGYAVPRGLTKLRNSRAGRRLLLPSVLGETASPPLLSKLPLTFGVPGRGYVNNHRTGKLRLAPITGVLLHFKFFADFHRRVARALAEGQHFDSGTEYARYAAALRLDPAFGFADEQSVRYRDGDDLARRGFMLCDPDYESFIADQQRASGAVDALVAA